MTASNAQAPVDVLREARAYITTKLDENSPFIDKLDDALASVAETMEREKLAREALSDAVNWIADLTSNDTTTHPRLKCLRATLARVQGGAQ